MGPDRLSKLIGAIYECALNPGLWPDVLTDLRTALHFHNATLALQSLPAETPLLSASSGIESEWLGRIPDYSADFVERWGGAQRLESLPFHEPAVLSWVSPRARWEATRYYREWARPQGIIDIMAIGVSRDERSIGSIILGRHESARAITPEDVEWARLLVPHLQRAVAISRILELRRILADGMTATLDTLTASILLVDPRLAIVHANHAARAALGKGGVLFERASRLRLASPGATAALANAVRRVVDRQPDGGARALTVPVDHADGKSRLLYVLPLPMAHHAGGATSVAAVMMAAEIDRAPRHAADVARLFDLTAAEQAVLESILSGRTLAETAHILQIALATVKTHLQHLFDKTGVRRQATLVALVSSLGLPVQIGDATLDGGRPDGVPVRERLR